MPVAVIDSNVLIAMASRRDQAHDIARDIVSGIDQGDLPAVRVTNYVVAEVLNYLRERNRGGVATDVYDRLDAGLGFEIVHATKSDYNRALDLFDRFESLSFVDGIITAYMMRTDLEYLYTFDDDFDAVEEITRLSTAANPSV
ncbi:type II toxin-antitoxin system VapC family toxin [Halorientalis pallida]|uniref:type II toxin-antitoxin system VapC family toxin n=1 Tax=Halorientalis pallida TaxID=2479928 RepID=UPI003C705329